MIYDKALNEKEKDLVVLAFAVSMACLHVPPDISERTLKKLYSTFMKMEFPESEPKNNGEVD